MVNGSTVDHSLDVRLDRRLKRRLVSNRQYKNYCCKTSKKHELEEFDAEYRKFLDNLPMFVDSSEEIVEAKPQDFGRDNDDNGTSRCKWLVNEVDPVYEMFFQHLIEEGKAYKLEIPSVDGMKVYVKYEEDEKSSPKKDQNSKKPGTIRTLTSASRKDEIASTDKESPVPLFEEEFSLDCAKPISNGVNGNSSTMLGTGLLSSAKRLSLSDSDSDNMDEDYKTFLTDFLYDDRRYQLMPPDGRRFVYEHDGSISKSEVVKMNTDSCKRSSARFGRKYLRSAMDIDSGKSLQSPGIYKSSNFRERLIKVLQKPYDQREYDFFLQEVGRRRPHVRHRELRSRVLKPYTLESRAKSYLHLYDDLAMKIQSVQYDCPRTLNLLRGFFYWLQNLSHEDAFQPWMDPSCLNVLPLS